MNTLPVEIIPDEEIGGFTAQIPGVSAYGEGETEELAISDLRDALIAYVAEFGIENMLTQVIHPRLRMMAWNPAELAHA